MAANKICRSILLWLHHYVEWLIAVKVDFWCFLPIQLLRSRDLFFYYYYLEVLRVYPVSELLGCIVKYLAYLHANCLRCFKFRI